jgi:hypothetical protein
MAMKQSTHNAMIIRDRYEYLREMLITGCVDSTGRVQAPLIPTKVQAAISSTLKQTKYEIDKTTKEHVGGIPAKLIKNLLMGEPVEVVMLRMFGDEDAGKMRPAPRSRASVKRSLDAEVEHKSSSKKKVVVEAKGSKKAVAKKVLPKTRKR